MTTTWFQKLILGIAGVSAVAIGAAITFVPHAFYASYGLSLGDNPDLLSELRAPGANLAALGVIILAGIIRPGFARTSALVGQTLFLAYAFGRIVSVTLDGLPSDGIVQAIFIELAIGGLCLVAFWRLPVSRGSARTCPRT